MRDQDIEEQQLVGQQALNRALKLFNRSVKDLTEADWRDILQWRHIESKDSYFEQIAVGDLLHNWLPIIFLHKVKVWNHRHQPD